YRTGAHHKALRRARAAAKWIARDQRKLVIRRWLQQIKIFRIDNANLGHSVAPLVQSLAARVKPFELDGVALLDRFQRPEPACAMAGQHQVSRAADRCTTQQTRRTKGQCARRGALQNDFVVPEPRDFEARNRIDIRPRPWRSCFAGMDSLLPRAADQNPRQLRLGLEVQGASGEARAGKQEQCRKPAHGFHDIAPALRSRSSKNSVAPSSKNVSPTVSRNASAVPVAGAPVTFSICQPAGSCVGTATVFCAPPGFNATSSPATNEVKRVTSRYCTAVVITSVRTAARSVSSDCRQRSIKSSTRCRAQSVVIPGWKLALDTSNGMVVSYGWFPARAVNRTLPLLPSVIRPKIRSGWRMKRSGGCSGYIPSTFTPSKDSFTSVSTGLSMLSNSLPICCWIS